MYVSLKGFNVCKIYLTSVKKRNNLQSLVYITPIYFFTQKRVFARKSSVEKIMFKFPTISCSFKPSP